MSVGSELMSELYIDFTQHPTYLYYIIDGGTFGHSSFQSVIIILWIQEVQDESPSLLSDYH